MTEWEHLVRYFCHVCSEVCINHRDSDPAQATECRSCYSIPDLDQADPLDEERDAPARPARARRAPGRPAPESRTDSDTRTTLSEEPIENHQ